MIGLPRRLGEWLKERWSQSPGQSLVETALFLPILLAIMVSVVEVGNSLNNFLTLENATREGARFGAGGGTDAGINQVVTSTLNLRLDMNASNTDVFVIRGETNGDGTAIESWTETHTYGSAPPATSGVSQAQVLADLQSQGVGNAAGLQFVAAAAHYDLKSMLGVPLVSNLSQIIPMSAYSVMQIESATAPDNSVGCDVYPMAVSQWYLENKLLGNDEFKYSNEAQEDQAHFAWLYWDCQGACPDPLEMAEYLSHPGTDPVFNRERTAIRIGDWVPGFRMDTQLCHSTEEDWAQLERVMTDHVDTGRTLLMVVFDHNQTRPGGGDFCDEYRVVGFAVVKIERYNIESYQGYPDRFHTVQYLKEGDYSACGQQY